MDPVRAHYVVLMVRVNKIVQKFAHFDAGLDEINGVLHTPYCPPRRGMTEGLKSLALLSSELR